MHKCSLAVANGSLLDDPLMMCSWVSNEAFLCGPSPLVFFCSVSRNFGRTPETPLFACSRTSWENASSELSPFRRSATSIGFAGSSKCRPRWSDFQPSHHVSTDDGEEGNGARADMWPEFLLQDLQKIALREIHPEDGVKLVVPRVRFGADGHRQRDEVLGRHVWNVCHHALEVADLFENANMTTEDMDIQLQAPPLSRRSSSRVPRLQPR